MRSLSQRGTRLRASVAVFVGSLTLAQILAHPAAHAATPSYRPNDGAQVVLRLDRGETLIARLRNESRAAPLDARKLIRYVHALMAAGTNTGNERYYGYAEQALANAQIPASAEMLMLRAQLLQHRHEFREAERALSALLAHEPRRADALLIRAQIRLHLHEPEQALRDCATLVGAVDLLTSSTCTAQARAAGGDVARAFALISELFQVAPATSATRSWSAGIAAELAARLGNNDAAMHWFRVAFELGGDSHYARIVYADWLLAQHKNAEAYVVASTGASYADRLRAVLAKGTPYSDDARRLQLLWKEASERGEREHLRDRARFELAVLRDSAQAHATALDNFRDHREVDDALLLATTSAAYSDSRGLALIKEWQTIRRYTDKRLDILLGNQS